MGQKDRCCVNTVLGLSGFGGEELESLDEKWGEKPARSEPHETGAEQGRVLTAESGVGTWLGLEKVTVMPLVVSNLGDSDCSDPLGPLEPTLWP